MHRLTVQFLVASPQHRSDSGPGTFSSIPFAHGQVLQTLGPSPGRGRAHPQQAGRRAAVSPSTPPGISVSPRASQNPETHPSVLCRCLPLGPLPARVSGSGSAEGSQQRRPPFGSVRSAVTTLVPASLSVRLAGEFG